MISYIVQDTFSFCPQPERGRAVKKMEPIDTRSLREKAQARIKGHILANELQPGDPLPTEATLVQQLGVSRTVIREALRALESIGIIESRRGEGHFIKKPTLDPFLEYLSYAMLFDYRDMIEIHQVREYLEVSLIPAAVAALDESTLVKLRALVAEMYARAEAGEFSAEQDAEFHRLLYLLTGNRLLNRLNELFWQVFLYQREHGLVVNEDPATIARRHEVIVEALEAHDVRAAQSLVIRHYAESNDPLREWYDRMNARQSATEGG